MAKDGEGADQSLLDHGTDAPSSTPGPPTHSRVKKDVRKIGYVEWLTTSYSKPYDPATDDFWWVDRAAPSSDGGEPPRCWLADLYVFPNWSLFSHYFNIGIALAFLATPVSYYLVETLNASAAVTNTYAAATYLPWCLKIFFGLQSDLYPVFGMHRRSYYAIGWIIFVVSNVWLMALGEPSIAATLILSFTMTMGALLSDTVADAIILECSKFERPSDKGRMRTHGYLVRQAGSTLGSALGAVVYNGKIDGGNWNWGLTISQCFGVQSLLVIATLLPLMPFMYEIAPRADQVNRTARELWGEMWNFVSLDGVWIPMMYLYFYNFCYISNPAWYNFLFDGLNFSNWDVGVLTFIGSLMSVAGLYMYEHFFFQSAWRFLYIWTTFVSACFSMMQICLVTGHTFGMPDMVFATGDTSLQTFVQTLTFMPMCIMFFALIPEGTEGTTYALISTWQNVAAEVGYDLGTLLDCVVNVSNTALEKGHNTGMLKLTIITSLIQAAPILMIFWSYKGVRFLPDSIVETKAQTSPSKTSQFGAGLFMCLFFGSIFASMAEAVWVIVYPNSC